MSCLRSSCRVILMNADSISRFVIRDKFVGKTDQEYLRLNFFEFRISIS